jgi:tight adherence protein C
LAVPAFIYLFVVDKLHQWSSPSKTAIMVGSMLLAYYMPNAYLRRKTRLLQDQYRYAFPDFLDLLMVCIEAGLSLEAALERIAREISTANREIGINLAIMGAEVRAGLGTIDGIRRFAERLGLEEAKSLAMLLQQSLELGSDISQALKTFSDEMRDKRLARAEEKANQLPVKLTLPICLFIFPVILIVVLGPILMKLLPMFSAMGR